MMVGERLREARQAQHLSLTQVAGKASISAATLSRIETSKQGVDLGLFLTLARILKSVPHELLGEDPDPKNGSDPLVRKIAALKVSDRIKLWRDLAESKRTRRGVREARELNLNQQVEELVAQVEYLREEIDSVRLRLKKRK